jgi:hypothetical protein
MCVHVSQFEKAPVQRTPNHHVLVTHVHHSLDCSSTSPSSILSSFLVVNPPSHIHISKQTICCTCLPSPQPQFNPSSNSLAAILAVPQLPWYPAAACLLPHQVSLILTPSHSTLTRNCTPQALLSSPQPALCRFQGGPHPFSRDADHTHARSPMALYPPP